MRRIAVAAAAVFAAVMSVVAAPAQDYPAKAVTVVVPYPAGGGTDGSARMFSKLLAEKFGVPFLVENRPGGSGVIAVRDVATADPDGYTLFYGSPSAFTPYTVVDFPIDVREAFSAVAGTFVSGVALVIRSDVGVTTMDELVAYAKAHPGELKYAAQTPTTGMMMELFKKREGLDILRVPYPGSAPARNDLMGGTIQLIIDNYSLHLQARDNGDVRLLGLVSDKRRDLIADVPTMEEAGYGYIEGSQIGGFFAPKGADPAIIDKLNDAVNDFGQDPEIAEKLAGFGYAPYTDTPAEADARLKREVDFWQETGESVGFRPGQ